MNEIKILEKKIHQDLRNIAGMVVLKDGKAQYENYFNGYTADSWIHVYSVTKSILSILIGIAVDKGYIKSVGQKVLDFFPDYQVKKGEQAIYDVTLENLLTMTAPYKYKLLPPYIKYFTSDDWVKFSLDLLGGQGRLGKFRYAPLIGPDILSGILINATGKSVLGFAVENLFAPLGITVKENLLFKNKEEQMVFNRSTDISGWAADSSGTNAAGWGLTLSPLDMAKIGQLYLNKGEWNKKQVVSEQWVNESIREHSRWDKIKRSYGYLWWILSDNGQSFAAVGDGGNMIYCDAEKHLVVSIASLFVQKPKDRIAFVKDYVEPLF